MITPRDKIDYRRHQLRQPDKVVGSSCERECRSDYCEASIFCLPQVRDGFHPTEALFDAHMYVYALAGRTCRHTARPLKSFEQLREQTQQSAVG